MNKWDLLHDQEKYKEPNKSERGRTRLDTQRTNVDELVEVMKKIKDGKEEKHIEKYEKTNDEEMQDIQARQEQRRKGAKAKLLRPKLWEE